MLIEWTTLAGTYLANNVFIDYTLVASPPPCSACLYLFVSCCFF